MSGIRALRPMSMSGKPDFIAIVGAPRCGTTSLAGFLQDHPEVCFSRVKEPHFFSRRDLRDDASDSLRQTLDEEYLGAFFPHRRDGAVLAEGSVSYLYAPEQMAPILRRWPDARFVIAVRDPMEMIPSLHQRLLYTGDETVADLERAWALIPERRRGRAIPRSCIDPRLLQYQEVGRLGAYVEAFFQAVGRERCFVAVFDDLAADPADLYARLLEFLGLAPQPRSDFAPRRVSRSYRLGWLQRLLKRPPAAVRGARAGDSDRLLTKAQSGPAPLRNLFAVRKQLLRWNQAPPPQRALPPALRAEIREALSGDVAHLSAVIGRDLGHWLAAAPAARRAEPALAGRLARDTRPRAATAATVAPQAQGWR